MEEKLVYFNSRDLYCKKPYGAVRSDRKLTLCLSVSRRMAPRRVTLLWGKEEDEYREYPLIWQKTSHGRDLYRVILPPSEKGLYRYCFRLETAVSKPYYGASLPEEGGEGRLSYDEFDPFFLTVYDPMPKVPEWFGDGITYQIFPDRFASEGEIPALPGRVLIRDRSQVPFRKEEANGDVLNNYFYGGNLRGIIGKLDYLKTLSVKTIYLNPIFLSESNHRYDTADYLTVDPMLGDVRLFTELCGKAEERGIRVMLDGVFNHTGNNSLYFNQSNTYPVKGASQGEDSPYYSWYRFKSFPDDYDCWWGIRILPAVDKNDPSFRDFIYRSRDSVVRRWLHAGASAWRLDVADELPDDFIRGIHEAAVAEKEDAFILGEVWEDASRKIAYGKRREYFLGGELDGVMNYPYRKAILCYLLEGKAEEYRRITETLRENYPYPALRSCMNILGTHDTPRILTLLGGDDGLPDTPEERARYRLPEKRYTVAMKRMKIAVTLLFTHIGSPTVYYGDECGMQGLEDPCNRAWFAEESEELTDYYRKMAGIRKAHPVFSHRAADILEAAGGRLTLQWGKRLALFINAGDKEESFLLCGGALDLIGGKRYDGKNVSLEPLSVILVSYEELGGREK